MEVILRWGTPTTASAPLAFTVDPSALTAPSLMSRLAHEPAALPLAATEPNPVGGAPASARTRSMSGDSRLKATLARGCGVQ